MNRLPIPRYFYLHVNNLGRLPQTEGGCLWGTMHWAVDLEFAARHQTVFVTQLRVLALLGVTQKHTFLRNIARRTTQRIRDLFMRTRYLYLHFAYLLNYLFQQNSKKQYRELSAQRPRLMAFRIVDSSEWRTQTLPGDWCQQNEAIVDWAGLRLPPRICCDLSDFYLLQTINIAISFY